MKEILFRGKRIDNGEWIEGYYVKTVDYLTDSAVHLIIELPSAFYPRGEIAGEYEINSSTVGQYTGLTDKNGKKIFEGDIVEFRTSLKKYYAKVYYKKGMWSLYIKGFNDRYMLSVAVENDYSVKVIGNIHDNPELLEVEE